MYIKIVKGEYSELPSHLTPEAVDIIRGMLNTNPEKRLTLEQVQSHKWFTSTIPEPPQIFKEVEQPRMNFVVVYKIAMCLKTCQAQDLITEIE